MMAESPIATELTKRLRALKKKLTKISAIEVMEESKRNKEQVALLATKGDVECCIRELDAFKSKLDSLDLLGSDRPSCEMGNSGSKSTTSKKAKTQEGSVNETNAGPSDAGAAKSVQLRVVASEGPECTYQQVEVLDSLSVKDLVDQISHAEVVPMPGFVYPDGAAQSKAEARRGTSAGASGAVSEEVVAKATAQAVHEALRKLAELMVVMQRYPAVATVRSKLAGKMPQLAALLQGENSSVDFTAAVDASAAACKAFVASEDKYEMVGDVAAVASLRSKVADLAHRLKTSQFVSPPRAAPAAQTLPGPSATETPAAAEPAPSLPARNDESTTGAPRDSKSKRNRKKRGGKERNEQGEVTAVSAPAPQAEPQGQEGPDENPEFDFTFGAPGSGLEESVAEENNLEAFEEPTFTFGADDDDDVGPYSTVAQPSPPPPLADRKHADASLMGPPPFAPPSAHSSGLVLPPYGGAPYQQQPPPPPLSYLTHDSTMGMGSGPGRALQGMGLGMQPGMSAAIPHQYAGGGGGGGGAPASAAASAWSQPSHSLPSGGASSHAWPSSGNAAVVDSLFSALDTGAEPSDVAQQQSSVVSRQQQQQQQPSTDTPQPGEEKGAKKSRKKKPKASSNALSQDAVAPNVSSGTNAPAPSSMKKQAPNKPTPLPSAATSLTPPPDATAPSASKRNRGKKSAAPAPAAPTVVEPEQGQQRAGVPQEASNDQKKGGSQRRNRSEGKGQRPSQTPPSSEPKGKVEAQTQEPLPGKGKGGGKVKATNKPASTVVLPAPAAASAPAATAPAAPAPAAWSASAPRAGSQGKGEAKKGTRAATPANSTGDSAKGSNGKGAKGKGSQPKNASEVAGEGNNSKGGNGSGSAGKGDGKGGKGKGGGKGGKGKGSNHVPKNG